MKPTVVVIRGKKVSVVGSSKADIARELLQANYEVSEISKAVPMAYSQVHSISKKMSPDGEAATYHPILDGSWSSSRGKKSQLVAQQGLPVQTTKSGRKWLVGAVRKARAGSEPQQAVARRGLTQAQIAAKQRRECDQAIDLHILPHSKDCPKAIVSANKRRAKELKQPKLGRHGTGRLRIPGNPLDVPAGKCANCSFNLVIKRTPYGYVFAHTGDSAEDYLAITQFCQAVPATLLP